MAAIFRKQPGMVDITATADITAGDVLQLGSRVGIALSNAKANSLTSLRTDGQFEVDTDGAAIALNSAVFFDPATKKATATSGSGTFALGIAVSAAQAVTAPDTATVLVDINV